MCSDPEQQWWPQRAICYASMEAAAVQWRYKKQHKDAQFHDGSFQNFSETRTDAAPYSYDDGVRVFVAPGDFTPGDDFLGQADSDDERDKEG